MNEQQALEQLFPEPPSLSASARASMRADLFEGSASTRQAIRTAEERRPVLAGSDDGGRRHRRPVRRRATLAAGIIGAVGVAGVWAVSSREPGLPAPAQQPTSVVPPSSAATAPASSTPEHSDVVGPSAFPVVEDLPAGLSASASVQRAGNGWTSPRTELLIGRRVDGVLADTVQIAVWAEPFEITPMQGRAPDDAVVLGQNAQVHDRSQAGRPPLVLVSWGSGPYFVASGEAPLALLDRASPDAITGTSLDPAEPPRVSLGTLPAGFDVVVRPQLVTGEATTFATLSIGSDNYDISVHADNPLLNMGSGGFPLRSVDVNGQPGWTYLSSAPTQDLTWQVDATTYAYLKVNDGSSSAEALAFAETITFVDFETWTARYEPDFVEVPASTPPTDPTE